MRKKLLTSNLKYMIILIFCTITVGFFYAYPVTFTQKMIDELSGLKRWSYITGFILFYMLCRCAGCLLDYVNAMVSKIISNNLSIELKNMFLKQYYAVDSEFIYSEKFEKIYTMYDTDIAVITNGICGPVLWFFSSVSLFIWSSVTLMNIRWELAVIYMIAAIMIVLVTVKTGKAVKNMQAEKRKTEEKKVYLAKSAIEQYMKFLIMKYSDEIIAQNMEAEKNYNSFALKESGITNRKTLVNDSVYYLAGACVWLAGSRYILCGTMTTGEIVAFISFAGLIISPIVRFSSQWVYIQKMLVAKKRIEDFLFQPSTVRGSGNEKSGSMNDLIFRELTFSYSEEQILIEKFSGILKNGQIYCIQGGNGCGKSTLLKLICRIHDSYAGEIYYGNQDIRSFSRDAWYDIIAYEDDSPMIILGSLYENLTLGLHHPDRDEIDYLCKKIGLFDSLDSMYSFDTVLEKGSRQLSNGQKQMIGVIRSLLSHKKILILDETLSGIAYPVVCEIMELYREYCLRYDSMLLYVSHDKEYQMLADVRVKIREESI